MLSGGRKRYRFYPQEKSRGWRLLALAKLVVILFVVYELVSTFLVASFGVSTEAMRPTFEPGDRVLVSSVPFGAHLPLFDARGPSMGEPRRGDLVVVETRYAAEESRWVQPLRSAARFFTGQREPSDAEDWRPEVALRRVIALPGDEVRMEDFIFYVKTGESESFVSEFEASGVRYALIRQMGEDRWSEELPFGPSMQARSLGEGEYFLAADNRIAGIDSRHNGPSSADPLRARILLRYWPFDRFGAP
jgi:signal peptidase I